MASISRLVFFISASVPLAMHPLPATVKKFVALLQCAAALLAGSATLAAQPNRSTHELRGYAQTTRPLLEQNCIECHGEGAAEADLRLDTLTPDLDDPEAFATWVKVHDKLRAGEMPPPEVPQPEAAQVNALLKELSESLEAASSERQAREGRTQFRRLNRVEYEHTLRDLFAMPNLDVKGMLPTDNRAHGFDNVGAALELSYVQMSRYLEAANAALDAAVVLKPRPEKISRRETLLEANGIIAGWYKKGRDAVKVGNAYGLLRQPNSAMTVWTWRSFTPEVEGRYQIRLKMFAFMWDKGEVLPADQPHVVSLYAKLGKEKRWLASFDVTDEPAVAEATVWLRPGEVPEVFLATLEGRRGGLDVAKHTGPGVAIEWLEVEGPVVDQWPPESHWRLFGDLPVERWSAESGFAEPPPPTRVRGKDKRAQVIVDREAHRYMVVSDQPLADAERLLRDFMRRALRRPVHEGEVQRYLALVKPKLEQNLCFQEAMRIGYQAVLCSPDFLFLHEEPGRLDDYALASRLSYLLWKSMPDDRLLELAEKGRLGQNETLHAQVERMIDDPKSRRFVENFVEQWLELRDIAATEPDDQLYPRFDQLLLDSMVWETHEHFVEMLRHDLGADHLIDSDFVMINGRLAELYGIAGVEGVDIRKVKLPSDSPRGGFLTQASVLKVTANGTTTSPVTRGAWVVDRLLGQPVPPPPPNVTAIEPDLRGTTTIREQLDRHREVESCAVCHKRMDPPGFALESFDVIGGWRDTYRSLGGGEPVDETFKGGQPVRYGLGQPVESGGVMPDGQKFDDIDELRKILLGYEEQLARSLASKLLIYATGAGIQFADHGTVENILANSRDNAYGLRTLIHQVVQSDAFRSK